MNIDPKLIVEAGEKGYEIWNWWQKWRYGTVKITHPQNRSLVSPDWVEVEGTQKKAKGHFWLVTAEKDTYWLQEEIDLRSDGHWKATININPIPGPRYCNLLLVRVSDFVHDLFQDIKDRSRRSQYWGPIHAPHESSQFAILQALVLNVNGPSQKP